MSSPKVTGTGRKVIKRACDGCKIRKIKCSEVPPCDGCNAVGIACTFEKRQRARGPRTLRAKTIRVIAQAQQQQNTTDDSPAPDTETPLSFDPSPKTPTPKSYGNTQRTPIAALVLRLCVYRLRLYAVWPIVAVEEVMASLQRDEHDMETYALANAVAAATIAQLKLNRTEEDATSASLMESECQRAKALDNDGPQVNLNTLKIAFFLHIYHENDQPGGVKSLLYLREAITLAQIMGLHKESTYTAMSMPEQQIRRRILWLLFVTERGVAMLHKLPVVLKANVLFPSMDGDDESQVLPAFMKLINLFWIFDKSGAFDILQNAEGDTSNQGAMEPASRNCLDSLQQKLQEVPIDGASTSDVQRADICVTRQWMCALLWKATMNNGRSQTFQRATSLSHPIQIAQDFLGVISKLPNAAIEAHGPTMEFKIYEIATAVTESLANESPVLWDLADGPRDILNQLQRVLASCRGGNKKLISMLCNKIEGIQGCPRLLIEPSSRVEEVEWPIESTASSDQTFDLGLDSTTAPPEFLSSGEFSKNQNVRNGYINNFQQIMPHFSDLPWGSHVVETLNTLSPPVDLFEQLQNFNNSFNSAESPGTLDRFLSSSNLWNGSDADMLNMPNENPNFSI